MEGGLLSLKWNNHRSTFLQVLSTVRHKESYSDVTIACDGKFYPVHKLVLSTCSEYFEQMFERTNCKHPIIVLKDIKKDDLEALLNYMYVGEVNVLQNNLSGLIKAAEGLRIKGLAVPDESPSEPETQDSKRSVAWGGDEPDAKRRRQDETPATSPRPPVEKSVRERSPASYRDAYRTTFRNRDPISPVPITPSPETHPPPAAPDPPPDLPPPPTPSLVPPNADVGGTEPVRPPEHEVKVDDALVKEEPHENYAEAEESKEGLGGDAEGLNYTHTTTAGGLEATTGPGRFSPGLRPAAQPQTLEDLVALPGASGLQGKPLWEGDRALLGIPFESYTSNQPPRASQMGPRSSNPSELLGQTLARAIQSAHVCPVCGHLARQRKDLKKHLRVHTGEKPYACPICPYRSTQNSNLKTHMRRLHTQAVLPESSRPTSTQSQTTTTPVACPPLYVD